LRLLNIHFFDHSLFLPIMTTLELPALPATTVFFRPDANNTTDCFSAVLLYEDLVTAHRAATTAAKLASGLQPGSRLVESAWRFDVLQEETPRKQALMEIASSDAVIVSSRHDLLPGAVQDLLDASLRQHRERPLVLILLSGDGESWSITIRHTAGFAQSAAGFAPFLDGAISCGYSAIP